MAPPPPPLDAAKKVALLGTVLEKEAGVLAVLEDIPTKKQSLYRLGSPVPNIGILATIEKDRVLFRQGASEEWLNLALAHYREVSGSLVPDAGREVLVRLRTMPLAITDLKSWLFFGLGLLCSLIAFADSFLIFDPYPGYGGLEKRRIAT